MSEVSRNRRLASSSARNSLQVDSETATYWRSISRRSVVGALAGPGSPASRSHELGLLEQRQRLVVVLALGLEPGQREQRLGGERHHAELAEQRRRAPRRVGHRLRAAGAGARWPAAAAGTRPTPPASRPARRSRPGPRRPAPRRAACASSAGGVAAHRVELRQRAVGDGLLDAVAEPLRPAPRPAARCACASSTRPAASSARPIRVSSSATRSPCGACRARLLERRARAARAPPARSPRSSASSPRNSRASAASRRAPAGSASSSARRKCSSARSSWRRRRASRPSASSAAASPCGCAGLARDPQRLAEVLLGQVPLAEAVADQAQVLVVAAHAGVQARALVEVQRLLEEARGLAPLAQVLVDEARGC